MAFTHASRTASEAYDCYGISARLVLDWLACAGMVERAQECHGFLLGCVPLMLHSKTCHIGSNG